MFSNTIDFMLQDKNLLFTFSLGVMAGIAALEGSFALLGLGMASVIDAMLPDFDVDVDIDVDAPDSTALSKFYSWIPLGRVPAFVLFIVFITSFGLIGIFLQAISFKVLGSLSPTWVVAILSFGMAFVATSVVGKVLATIMPKDFSNAVSEDQFVGRLAQIVVGTSRKDHPAQAKLNVGDQRHYVMVEPEDDEGKFTEGEKVIITEKKKGINYLVVKNTDVFLDKFEIQ